MKKQLISLIVIGTLMLSVAAFAASAQDSASGHPFLGITFGESDSGALVTNVLRNTPAADAGLKTGDIITALNGAGITAANLADAVGKLSAGDSVKLDVLRNGEPLEIDATLGAQPEHPSLDIMPFHFDRAWLGVALKQTDAGIVIDSVTDGSPAAEAGLQAGDVLTAIDGDTVETSAAAAAMIRDLKPGDKATLSITRDGEHQEIEITLGSRAAVNADMPMMRGDVIMFDGQNWRIVALSDNSALAEAGLQAGDVVTAINGESLDLQGLGKLLDNQDANTTVTLTVERDGATQEIEVPVETLSAFTLFNFGQMFRGQPGDMPFSFDVAPGNVRLGVQFANIDADVATKNDLSVTEGALITEVLPDSPADTADLKAGDVVVSVDGDKVDAERTLRDRLFAYEPGDQITLEVLRDGETLKLDVTLGSGIDMNHMPFNFGFGEDGAPRFFFGPRGNFDFPHPPVNAQPAAPAANA